MGLLINPLAGIGGPGAFKGSDGHWKEALAAGYQPHAGERAERFAGLVGDEVTWVTLPGAMGLPLPDAEMVLADQDLALGDTSAADTAAAATALRDARVDLLCFVGGDGTAADVARAIGDSVPCLGVPAGVKITSPVFAHDLDEAAWLVANLLPGFETTLRDTTDLDEKAYRAGRLDVHLTGSLRVPLSPAVQGGKAATTVETPLDGIIEQVLSEWGEPDITIIGAGSVCLAIKRQFWGDPTLLGFDAVQGNKIIEKDLDDRRLEELMAAHEARVILSPIGGQGMLVGRGTQVLRPDLLARIGWQNVWVVAPQEKLVGVPGLHVDTGDAELDAAAPKYIRVTTGWRETRMVRILASADTSPPADRDRPGAGTPDLERG